MNWKKEYEKRNSELSIINKEIRRLEKEKKKIGSPFAVDIIGQAVAELLGLHYRRKTFDKFELYKLTKKKRPRADPEYICEMRKLSFDPMKASYFDRIDNRYRYLPEETEEIVSLIKDKRLSFDLTDGDDWRGVVYL